MQTLTPSEKLCLLAMNLLFIVTFHRLLRNSLHIWIRPRNASAIIKKPWAIIYWARRCKEFFYTQCLMTRLQYFPMALISGSYWNNSQVLLSLTQYYLLITTCFQQKLLICISSVMSTIIPQNQNAAMVQQLWHAGDIIVTVIWTQCPWRQCYDVRL